MGGSCSLHMLFAHRVRLKKTKRRGVSSLICDGNSILSIVKGLVNDFFV